MTEYTKEDCIEELQKASEKIGGPLSMVRFDEVTEGLTSDQVAYKFDTWNMAKKAADLRELQGGPGRIPPAPENVSLSTEEWERLTMNQRKQKRRHAKLSEIKMAEGCQECGYNEHPAALSFHHINPETKSFNIGANADKPLDVVLAEIEKCEVLCRNCHQIKSQKMSWLNL